MVAATIREENGEFCARVGALTRTNLYVGIVGLMGFHSKSLDAFHMKCQRRILGISWHQFVRNEEVAALTGLSSLSDIICRRRSAIFGHIARFGEEVPAHKALHNCISLSLGRLLDLSWKHRPGRPRGRWIDQLRRDDSQPPANLWRQAINSGHSGRAM